MDYEDPKRKSFLEAHANTFSLILTDKFSYAVQGQVLYSPNPDGTSTKYDDSNPTDRLEAWETLLQPKGLLICDSSNLEGRSLEALQASEALQLVTDAVHSPIQLAQKYWSTDSWPARVYIKHDRSNPDSGTRNKLMALIYEQDAISRRLLRIGTM